MYRLIFCLPLCLILAPNRPDVAPSEHRVPPGIVSHDPLPVADPVAFLEKCLAKYDEQHIEGFTCILQKQERIDGRLMPSEETEVAFRARPHSVFMHWVRGARKADSALYVQGENDNKMIAHPSGLAGALVKVVSRDVDGADAKQSGRYTLDTFGFKNSMERTLKANAFGMSTAKEASSQLQVYMSTGIQAWAASRAGDHETAERIFSQAETMLQELGGHLLFSDWFTSAHAEIAFNAGRIEEALELARAAVHYARSVDGVLAEGVAQRVWGQVLAETDRAERKDELDAHFAESLRRFEEGDAVLETARTHVAWGKILRGRGDVGSTREHFEQAAAQFEASGLTRELAEARRLLSPLPLRM